MCRSHPDHTQEAAPSLQLLHCRKTAVVVPLLPRRHCCCCCRLVAAAAQKLELRRLQHLQQPDLELGERTPLAKGAD